MRKASSFMCVLVVLLAGGAEAQRPLAKEAVTRKAIMFGFIASGLPGVEAWTRMHGCRKFSEIYNDGQDLVERMWGNSFSYSTDEARAYTMWWFEGGAAGTSDAATNPNDAITAAIGTHSVPNQCHLAYYHKDAPTPEGPDFTECHPWHASSCCHNSTVVTPQAISTGYGAGYEWDRCGPLSQACERFFVMEGCFYECEVNAGLYRKYTDEQHTLCTAAGVAQGATVTLASGASYTCTADPWSSTDNAENRWQMYQMPIKASFADAWYRACANDYFCGSGDYFACAGDYHAQLAAEAAEAAANATAAAAALVAAQELADQEAAAAAAAASRASSLENDVTAAQKAVPAWAVVVIVGSVILILFVGIGFCVLANREKAGKPIFKPMNEPAKSANVDDSKL